MNNFESDLIKFICGEHYEKCTNKTCKNCHSCIVRTHTVLPLQSYLEEKGYGSLSDLKSFCIKQCHNYSDKMRECEQLMMSRILECDSLAAEGWNNDYYKNISKFEAVQDVISKIDEVMNEAQN